VADGLFPFLESACVAVTDAAAGVVVGGVVGELRPRRQLVVQPRIRLFPAVRAQPAHATPPLNHSLIAARAATWPVTISRCTVARDSVSAPVCVNGLSSAAVWL